jgi:hypothetical protein
VAVGLRAAKVHPGHGIAAGAGLGGGITGAVVQAVPEHAQRGAAVGQVGRRFRAFHLRARRIDRRLRRQWRIDRRFRRRRRVDRRIGGCGGSIRRLRRIDRRHVFRAQVPVAIIRGRHAALEQEVVVGTGNRAPCRLNCASDWPATVIRRMPSWVSAPAPPALRTLTLAVPLLLPLITSWSPSEVSSPSARLKIHWPPLPT